MSLGLSELLLVLAIVVVLFGTKKLRTVGSDLGGAIRGFRQAMHNDDKALPQTTDNAGSADKVSETVENRS
ncbi:MULTISPECIES: twin-arginine translocase TatA/TatE family subunit [Methylomonas]|uniref:twin-arginine translocase TatA/TatE family subunit n=1 Tax=Methylomonas TaxID=416 RepID=UPI001E5E5D7F|nr:twin-arginine translocase TatA/TatE family subunit [Methylomonas rhizoryzae]